MTTFDWYWLKSVDSCISQGKRAGVHTHKHLQQKPHPFCLHQPVSPRSALKDPNTAWSQAWRAFCGADRDHASRLSGVWREVSELPWPQGRRAPRKVPAQPCAFHTRHFLRCAGKVMMFYSEIQNWLSRLSGTWVLKVPFVYNWNLLWHSVKAVNQCGKFVLLDQVL